MKKIILVLIPICLFFSCSTSKKVSKNNNINNKEIKMENDGSSYTKAIIIKEKTETEGIKAEYVWLKQHYPGFQLKQQSLSNYKDKSYDVMDIVTSDGEKKSVYFDISNFFGKY